jgi:hypothetical protein
VPDFVDVPPDHWAYSEVMACVMGGIVSGFLDGTYHADWPVYRHQMAVYIARGDAGGDGNVPDGPPQATFNDVPTDHWAYKYVEYCSDNEIVAGYDEVTYGPTGTVTRDQMAVFIARAHADGDGNVPSGGIVPRFNDVPTQHWAYKYVEYCADQDVVQGYDEVTYFPDAIVTRGQMAVFICRAFNLPT